MHGDCLVTGYPAPYEPPPRIKALQNKTNAGNPPRPAKAASPPKSKPPYQKSIPIIPDRTQDPIQRSIPIIPDQTTTGSIGEEDYTHDKNLIEKGQDGLICDADDDAEKDATKKIKTEKGKDGKPQDSPQEWNTERALAEQLTVRDTATLDQLEQQQKALSEFWDKQIQANPEVATPADKQRALNDLAQKKADYQKNAAALQDGKAKQPDAQKALAKVEDQKKQLLNNKALKDALLAQGIDLDKKLNAHCPLLGMGSAMHGAEGEMTNALSQLAKATTPQEVEDIAKQLEKGNKHARDGACAVYGLINKVPAWCKGKTNSVASTGGENNSPAQQLASGMVPGGAYTGNETTGPVQHGQLGSLLDGSPLGSLFSGDQGSGREQAGWPFAGHPIWKGPDPISAGFKPDPLVGYYMQQIGGKPLSGWYTDAQGNSVYVEVTQ